jgi:DNA-binding beta-propeller fold protein YncE
MPNGRAAGQGAFWAVPLPVASGDEAHLSALPAGCQPVRVALSPDDRRVFVSARGSNAISVLTAEGSKGGMKRVPAGVAPVGLAVTADGRALWVANSNRFRPDSPGSVARYAIGPDGLVVVTLFDSDALQIIAPGAVGSTR